MQVSKQFTLDEIGNSYAGLNDRFIVSLVVGYSEELEGVETPAQAVYAALELTRDEGSDGTQWWVFDRQTGSMQMYEQSQIDNRYGMFIDPDNDEESE